MIMVIMIMIMIMLMMMMIKQSAETNQVTTWHIPASKRGASPPQTLLHRSPQNFQQYFSLYQVFSRKKSHRISKQKQLVLIIMTAVELLLPMPGVEWMPPMGTILEHV